jgi:hypothetical protein
MKDDFTKAFYRDVSFNWFILISPSTILIQQTINSFIFSLWIKLYFVMMQSNIKITHSYNFIEMSKSINKCIVFPTFPSNFKGNEIVAKSSK